MRVASSALAVAGGAIGAPWYVDGTLGGCGHARAIAAALGGMLDILGIDRDAGAIERAREALAGSCQKLALEVGNFRDIDEIMTAHAIPHADMILLDLGISSDELDASGRGFSFMKSEPLLMTMGDPAGYTFTARDILNEWREEDIANVIFAYGEERYARRIAKAVIGYRGKKRIETTDELVEIVRRSVPPGYRYGRIHPATKTFQALRIAVNDELKALEEGLARAYERLAPGGRLAVISFHSLEDRIVKDFMREKAVATDGSAGATILYKKPVTASEQEIAENPRSRSAKLRAIEKKITSSQIQDTKKYD